MELQSEQPKSSLRKFSRLDNLELLINTVNHALIAITTFYITWYSFIALDYGEYQTVHGWFTTVGFQFFMSEGIMAFYSKNTYTMGIESRVWKKRIHWGMTAIGSVFATYGTIVMIYNREISGRKHFHNTHSISGELKFLKIELVVNKAHFRTYIWHLHGVERLLWLFCSLFHRIAEGFETFSDKRHSQLAGNRLLLFGNGSAYKRLPDTFLAKKVRSWTDVQHNGCLPLFHHHFHNDWTCKNSCQVREEILDT